MWDGFNRATACAFVANFAEFFYAEFDGLICDKWKIGKDLRDAYVGAKFRGDKESVATVFA